MPIVMREGNACGLMMMSGTIPFSVNGMFTDGHKYPKTPFWPCLDENLSPIMGLRGILYLTLYENSLVETPG